MDSASQDKSPATSSAILLIHCPDSRGIIAAVSEFISKNNGNILFLDQHVDAESGRFFMRLEWDLDGFAIPADKVGEFFEVLIGRRYDMTWTLHFSSARPRMAILVSKLPHCLFDLLARWRAGELAVEIPLIISNHQDLEPVARQFGVEFAHFPITPANKAEQEAAQLELLARHDIDFIVLARYMQILSPDFVDRYPNRIINIHHSFLPAFPGARPYHQAYLRGVKVIGATSHYVTADLDCGPIIAQDIIRVSHRDAPADLVRKGRDLERLVLARAVWHHVRRQVLVCENRTFIFA